MWRHLRSIDFFLIIFVKKTTNTDQYIVNRVPTSSTHTHTHERRARANSSSICSSFVPDYGKFNNIQYAILTSTCAILTILNRIVVLSRRQSAPLQSPLNSPFQWIFSLCFAFEVYLYLQTKCTLCFANYEVMLLFYSHHSNQQMSANKNRNEISFSN